MHNIDKEKPTTISYTFHFKHIAYRVSYEEFEEIRNLLDTSDKVNYSYYINLTIWQDWIYNNDLRERIVGTKHEDYYQGKLTQSYYSSTLGNYYRR